LLGGDEVSRFGNAQVVQLAHNFGF
jgi:hypothetical protein